MNRRSWMLLAAAGLAALVLATSNHALAEEVRLRYCHANTTSYPYHTAGIAFASALSAATSGEIDVTIFPRGQLGGERDILKAVQDGKIDLQALSIGVLGNRIQVINALNLPFVFASPEHFIEVTTGEIGEEILSMAQTEGAAAGILVLAVAGPMFRMPMNGSRPIHSVEDFRGMKIRTMEVPLHRDVYRALGATPVPLPFEEVYSALEDGVVDGNENGASALHANRFHEVQKYVSDLPVVSNSGALVMSAASYKSLSSDQQAAIHAAVAVWTGVMNADGLAQETEALEAMAEAGIEVSHVDDPSDFVAATRSVYKKYMADFSDAHRALVERILASQPNHVKLPN
ncbi:TRAP transporter substrate-binding protein [Tropicimonas sp. TH_r6]|uniref:TRAP transporter substrate-binding protein n=1 Tax=Tropicimonas sp. TH_r6 TaxID=3082085 RepID=UPI00295356F3|nr:TRAP transporter substrate-binding protein [Tropicimonas sp. TH_r6]MDV7141789.1 TRAP transporter substrate-binding protein [Tropicimonas sp. TH_r6]